MILIVDSWAWLSLLEGSNIAEKAILLFEDKTNKIFTTTLNLYEVYCRVNEQTNETEAIEFIETIKKQATIIQIDSELAISAGEIHIKDKLPAVDAFVYACAIKLDGDVVTGDPHFKGKPRVVFLS